MSRARDIDGMSLAPDRNYHDPWSMDYRVYIRWKGRFALSEIEEEEEEEEEEERSTLERSAKRPHRGQNKRVRFRPDIPSLEEWILRGGSPEVKGIYEQKFNGTIGTMIQDPPKVDCGKVVWPAPRPSVLAGPDELALRRSQTELLARMSRMGDYARDYARGSLSPSSPRVMACLRVLRLALRRRALFCCLKNPSSAV